MEETWKDIKGYEGLYQISSFGRIKGLEKMIKRISSKGKKFTINYPEKILKQYKNHKGYLITQLSKEGISKTYIVHRIVAQTFISNLENKKQVNHIDCNKTNNRVENLEWVTNDENKAHAKLNNLCKSSKGKENPMSKKVNQYDLNGKLVKRWNCMNDIARKINVKNVSNISACCKHKKIIDKNGNAYCCKTAYGYKWEYAKED